MTRRSKAPSAARNRKQETFRLNRVTKRRWGWETVGPSINQLLADTAGWRSLGPLIDYAEATDTDPTDVHRLLDSYRSDRKAQQ